MQEKKSHLDIWREIQTENGKKGGNSTLEKHGTAHFTKIGKKGVRARKKKAADRKVV